MKKNKFFFKATEEELYQYYLAEHSLDIRNEKDESLTDIKVGDYCYKIGDEIYLASDLFDSERYNGFAPYELKELEKMQKEWVKFEKKWLTPDFALELELLELAINTRVSEMEIFRNKYFTILTEDYSKVKELNIFELKKDIDTDCFDFAVEISNYIILIQKLTVIVNQKKLDLNINIYLTELEISFNTILRSQKTYILQELAPLFADFSLEMKLDYNSKVCKHLRFEI